LRAGLAAVNPESEAVLFLLGDQPEVDADVIDALIDAFERTRAPIVQPVYGGAPANPILFSRALFPELDRVIGDAGARSIIRQRVNDVMRVEVGGDAPPGDVDTDEDYQALVERWAERRARTE
jgi:molybdenum cofactor cytidylyltransferase